MKTGLSKTTQIYFTGCGSRDEAVDGEAPLQVLCILWIWNSPRPPQSEKVECGNSGMETCLADPSVPDDNRLPSSYVFMMRPRHNVSSRALISRFICDKMPQPATSQEQKQAAALCNEGCALGQHTLSTRGWLVEF